MTKNEHFPTDLIYHCFQKTNYEFLRKELENKLRLNFTVSVSKPANGHLCV